MYFQIIVVHIIHKIYQTYYQKSITRVISQVKNALFDFKKFMWVLQHFWRKK